MRAALAESRFRLGRRREVVRVVPGRGPGESGDDLVPPTLPVRPRRMGPAPRRRRDGCGPRLPQRATDRRASPWPVPVVSTRPSRLNTSCRKRKPGVTTSPRASQATPIRRPRTSTRAHTCQHTHTPPWPALSSSAVRHAPRVSDRPGRASELRAAAAGGRPALGVPAPIPTTHATPSDSECVPAA